MNCNCSLLFLIFKRPKTTLKVLEAIRKARPQKLYIAADGARSDHAGEAEKVAKAREIVLNGIDWPCEVKTLFREKNLGCRLAVSSAIDWFFEHEEEGIILEDDCLPDVTFFRFCKELLEYYRYDTRVMAISGNNFQQGHGQADYSYYFSRYPHCWGWATWKRAWQYWDGTLAYWTKIKEQNLLCHIACGYEPFIDYWTKIFDSYYANEIDSWAYPWVYSCWTQNGLSILPNANLVLNIGFNFDATHTKKYKFQYSSVIMQKMEFPILHPPFILRDVEADIFTDYTFFGISKPQSSLHRQGSNRIIPFLRGLCCWEKYL